MFVTRTRLVGCSVPLQQARHGWPGHAAALGGSGQRRRGPGDAGRRRRAKTVLRNLLAETRKLTSGSLGVNFLIPFLDRSCVEVAAAGARLVEFFYGARDPELVDLVQLGGALACWQVGSRDEAIAAVDAGCDLIVAQGREAGGHVRGQTRLLALLEQARHRRAGRRRWGSVLARPWPRRSGPARTPSGDADGA